ncbi:DUF1302 domain-containing protein [Azospirillum sp. B510]|uniref:DUF1302 domain-containing protein n=1 Tax=Azospirillum sp. (strain B510) TaxID=137722 RepID=UPI0020000FA7|nr:DUF1302 family protein [Azospirillum sp. B510]
MAFAGSAAAAQIETDIPDLKLRWDNTLKYSSSYRLRDADDTLLGNANLSDGDTNFRKRGLTSNRVDLLSEFEAGYRQFGLRLSGAAWYDSVYNHGNHNNTAGVFGPGTSAVNSSDISGPTQFNSYTRRVHGRDAELLDAFVSGNFNVGDHRATVRLGQHSVIWGESLFFGDNAIAGAMSPVDQAKALSVPNLRFQELLRPVPQASAQIQLTDALTAYSFYQFSWRPNRSQGAGSYFSPIDFQAGGDLILTPAGALHRTATRDGKNSGQGGVALRLREEDVDFGLYAVRFNDKSSQIVTNPLRGTFYEAYHNGINAFGASANRSMGLFNYAVETSIRTNQDLLSPNAYDLGNGPRYAVGRTFHANVSAFGSNLGTTPLWDDASLVGEVAFARVLSVQKNADTLSGCQPTSFPGSVCAPNGTRNSLRFQVLFEPVYYQALPGVDLRLPIGLGYQPKGSRNMVGVAPLPENSGSLNLGVKATYLDVWQLGLNVTHYFGNSGVLVSPVSAGGTQAWNYKQYFRDRDFISLNVSRTF